ncbi:hypothetical protein FE257_011357 [Aspergillus nanangensis]|uniref:Tyrosine specific protein phosphatases domain-containing protein n=1 Tax=Aspergillus nanangensis TaxID=2582783 RepID=A0AAD4GRI6_ASPNN|nr:hypothetical protein FE257_011357 [Aspergillus nanangensis]
MLFSKKPTPSILEEPYQFKEKHCSPPLEPSAISGLYNFRDVGGYRVPGNQAVRSGLVFRSANLDRLSPSDFRLLGDRVGISCVFDLRSAEESSTDDSWTSSREEITIHHVIAMNWEKSRDPVQAHMSLLSNDLVEAFMVIYRHLAAESAPAYAKILAHLRDHPECPIVVHCDLGKDRTGIFIAMLLKCLGVGNEDIVEDYSRTEGQIEALVAPKTEKYYRMTMLEMPAEGIDGHFRASREVMYAFLGYIDEEYGGGEGYVRFLGFNSGDIARLREGLLVPVD